MSNKSPVFPMPEPHHFSDYGFDPKFDYFQQVLEETRNQQREANSSRSIDSIRFKLQKPNSDDVIRTPRYNNNESPKKNRRWWWSKAFMMCFKFNWSTASHFNNNDCNRDVHIARARAFRSSASGPDRMLRSQPLLSPRNSPYLSLRELNVEQQHLRRMSGSASPIYFVT